MSSLGRFRVAVVVAGVLGLFALAGPAFASDANMEQVWDGSRFRGKVLYTEPWLHNDANDVTISMPSATQLTIKDRGAYIWSGWGWGQNYGCETATVSDFDRTFPATCEHPNGIVSLQADLAWDDGSNANDRFSLDRSVPSTLAVVVYGGGGNDELDVRGGSQRDRVRCGTGFDRAYLDFGDTFDGHCEFKLFDGTLNGQLTSGPTVASWGGNRLDVFYRGPNNELRQKWWDESGWHDHSLGGYLTSDPAAVSWGPGRIDIFARGQDNALWHIWFDGGWSSWESLGGHLTSAPAVSSWGDGRLDIFWRGANFDLRHRAFDGRWLAEESLGGLLTSKPAAVSWGPGRIDVFVRGGDGAAYHKWFQGGWSGWGRLDGQLGSGPALASRGSGMLDLFVLGTDNVLYRRTFANGNWSSFWESFHRQLTSDPAAISWAGGRLDVFGRASDGRLAQSALLP